MDGALRAIAEPHGDICAERLQPTLVAMAEHLARHGGLVLDAALRADLGRISGSAVRHPRSHDQVSEECPSVT